MRDESRRPAFCVNPLDRTSAEKDPQALEHALRNPESLHVILRGEEPVLLRESGRQSALSPTGSVPAQLAADRAILQAFLGTLDGRPVIASELAATEVIPDLPDLQVLDLRAIAVQGLVAEPELGLLAQAKALMSWHRNHGFCSRCGTATQPTSSRLRRDCPSCGAQHFPRTDPVVIMLVTRGDACLLGRQERFAPGMYSCLAGFVSQGETLEDAVRREVMEEAGIRVGPVRYLSSQPWPFPSSVMIGCQGEAETTEITLDHDELQDGRWFSRDEIIAMLDHRHPDGLQAPNPIAIAHHLLRIWIDNDQR